MLLLPIFTDQIQPKFNMEAIQKLKTFHYGNDFTYCVRVVLLLLIFTDQVQPKSGM